MPGLGRWGLSQGNPEVFLGSRTHGPAVHRQEAGTTGCPTTEARSRVHRGLVPRSSSSPRILVTWGQRRCVKSSVSVSTECRPPAAKEKPQVPPEEGRELPLRPHQPPAQGFLQKQEMMPVSRAVCRGRGGSTRSRRGVEVAATSPPKRERVESSPRWEAGPSRLQSGSWAWYSRASYSS